MNEIKEIIKAVAKDFVDYFSSFTYGDSEFLDYLSINEALIDYIEDKEKKYDHDYIVDLTDKVLDILEEQLNKLGFIVYYPGMIYVNENRYDTVPASCILVIRETKYFNSLDDVDTDDVIEFIKFVGIPPKGKKKNITFKDHQLYATEPYDPASPPELEPEEVLVLTLDGDELDPENYFRGRHFDVEEEHEKPDIEDVLDDVDFYYYVEEQLENVQTV
jgi:hypothetical protein